MYKGNHTTTNHRKWLGLQEVIDCDVTGQLLTISSCDMKPQRKLLCLGESKPTLRHIGSMKLQL